MFVFLNEDYREAIKALPDNSVDLILTDPPYGITQNKWDTAIDLKEFWSEMERVAKLNAAILIFGQGVFSAKLIESNAKHFRYQWTWIKNAATGFLNANKMPLKITESINVFYRKLPAYNPQMRKEGAPYLRKCPNFSTNYNPIKRTPTVNLGGRFPVDALYFDIVVHRKDAGRIHPTQKPVSLLEYLIKTYSNEGDVILDPFAGSCSCGHACLNTNRSFIGFEKDSEYYNLAKEGLNEL